jgi:hypothetical protein
MGNLIETVLQDAVLVSVQGNGDVSAQSVQMICILRMYREACTCSKECTGYTICMQYRKNEKCMARPTGLKSMKWCKEKVLLGKLASRSTISELWPLEIKKMFEVSTLDFNAVCCTSVQWLPDTLDNYRRHSNYVKSIHYLLQVLDLIDICCINSDFRCLQRYI